MKILHIINDEKFLQTAVNQFSSVKGANSTFILPVNNISELKHLKNYSSPIEIKCFPYETSGYYNEIEKINPDLIIVHGLSIHHKMILHRLKGAYKVLWFSWGRDIFSTECLREKYYYKPLTNKVVQSIKKTVSLKTKIGKIVFFFIKRQRRIPKDSLVYTNYISYISTVVREDFEAIQTCQKFNQAIKYIPFNYGGFQLKKSEVHENSLLSSKNIQIGNSANPENNHVESFDLLKDVDIADRKIIVPLSYGGSQQYIDFVVEEGKRRFGDNFYPLLTFLDKSAYLSIIDSVEIAIMNHSHQHAMGNIWYLMTHDKTIYMDFSNTAARSLIRLGTNIKSVETIKELGLATLSDEEKAHNKSVILKEYGAEAIRNRTQALVNYLSKELNLS